MSRDGYDEEPYLSWLRPGQRVAVDEIVIGGVQGYVVIPVEEELSDEVLARDAHCSCGSRMPCLSPMIKCFHPMRVQS